MRVCAEIQPRFLHAPALDEKTPSKQPPRGPFRRRA
jgi:hypothetical protein